MKTINLRTILKIVGLILIIISITFLFCIPVAVIYSEPVRPFILAFATAIIPGLMIYLLVRSSIQEKITIKEGYLSVTLGWLTMILSGTLPYIFSGEIKGFQNILFETTSGFTTTGSSILQDVEALSKSVLFWRSLTHWIGGIGIIVLVIIVLPTLRVGGYSLFSLESSMKQKILPKTKSIAYRIVMIYLGITAVEIVVLSLGGMNLFESVCNSFGTVATGGFSPKNNSIAGYSPFIQYTIAVFMFLSATSYVVFYYMVHFNFRKVKANEEFWFYIFVTTAAVVFVTLLLYTSTSRTFEEAFRHSFFSVISQISCTGSTGSTTGGIKMARHLISLKNIKNALLRLHHPKAVIPVKLNEKVVPDEINSLMMVFIQLYILIFIIGALIMVISGIPVIESAGASATSMAGIGPGMGASGNMGNYAHFNTAAKMTMLVLMLTGRLEIFTILALFTRSFWKN
jgi:trk system potassium uptake protein TrkH